METPIMNAKKEFPVWAIALMVLAVIIVVSAVAIVSGKSTEAKLAEKLELAQHYISELNYEQAIAMFNEALEIDPKAIEAYSGLADVYIAMGDEEKAREVLAQAQEEFPAEAVAELKAKVEEAYGVLPESTEAGQAAQQDPAGAQQKDLSRTERVDNADGTYAIHEYNANGYTDKSTFYSADGSLKGWAIYEYDANWHKIKDTRYNADGGVAGWFIYEYDADGHLVKITDYNEDGIVIRVDEYTNGHLATSTCYSNDGSLSQWCINEYDADGHMVRENWYDRDGNLYYVREY